MEMGEKTPIPGRIAPGEQIRYPFLQ